MASALEAALEALLGRDDPATRCGAANLAALQRIFLRLVEGQTEASTGRGCNPGAEPLASLLELYQAGELCLPFDGHSLGRDLTLAAGRHARSRTRSDKVDC